MERTSLPTDFVVPVEGLGPFTFARRTLRLEMATRAEFARLTEGQPVNVDERAYAEMISDLKVLLVSATGEGWSAAEIDNIDPYDTESMGRLQKVWSALRDKEADFRRKPAPASEGSGSGDAKNDGVLV